jgi:hypothetical protein
MLRLKKDYFKMKVTLQCMLNKVMTENLPEKKTTVFQDEDSLMLNKVVSET